MTRSVIPRSLASAAVSRLAAGAMLFVAAGCWPFHHSPTPQEQYYSAVSRGDAISAAYIWAQMSPKDRAKLTRGEGISPEFERQMLRQRLGADPQSGTSAASQGAAFSQNPASTAAVPQR
jgi:hypothetical protein